MMTAEENRKKVIRNNLLMGLLFCVTIIGIGGAVYYYGKLKETTASLEKAQAEISQKNDSLEKKNKELKEIKDELAKQKRSLENILDEASKNKDPEKILAPVANKRDSAREYARSGYEKLIQKDLVGAMKDFDKSEKSYNGYHDSYEVYFLLRQNRDKLDDPKIKQQLLEKILKDFNSLKKLTPANIK